MMSGYGYGAEMWGGGLLMILFWVAVVVLIVWALRLLFVSSQPHQPSPTHSTADIAAARYARGEISREDYLAFVEDLKHQKE